MALGLLLIRFDFLYRKVLRKRSLFWKVVTWTAVFVLFLVVGLYKLIVSSNDPMAITKSFIYIEPMGAFYRRTVSEETKDWNDYSLLKSDRSKIGYGEHGVKTYIENEFLEEEKRLIEMNGHNVMVSDKISLFRSIPDFRSDECKTKLYKKELPSVSVIIPFFDEHFTTLLRTLHSIMNRSPKELLKEVILVNDASSRNYLENELQAHIDNQPWYDKVKIFTMAERSGLIWSRLAGARYATGDVLLFVDCHVEVGYNFLPPLLEPIAKNYKAVVTPTLDVIDKRTYEIKPLSVGQTVFDWSFHSQRIPLHDSDMNTTLYQTPTIYGAAFAISAKYFWALQPDSGLMIYGGDQLEMSFKVNLCGGILYESSCSRVAHLYRRFPYAKHHSGFDFKARNNKRVAEIWLDDYKQYFYARNPERYRNLEIDVVDISKQLNFKKNFNCKPFSYFLDNIAPDMLERFPLVDYDNFASGTIRNKAIEKCLQTTDRDHGTKINLAECSHNKTNPIHQQHFMLRHFRDIAIHGKSDCLQGSRHSISYARCHYEQKNQYFRYDVDNLHIFWGRKRNNLCLDADLETSTVYISACENEKATQQWVWGFSRVSSLRNWTNNGAPILDETEKKDLLTSSNGFIDVVQDELPEGEDEFCGE